MLLICIKMNYENCFIFFNINIQAKSLYTILHDCVYNGYTQRNYILKNIFKQINSGARIKIMLKQRIPPLESTALMYWCALPTVNVMAAYFNMKGLKIGR